MSTAAGGSGFALEAATSGADAVASAPGASAADAAGAAAAFGELSVPAAMAGLSELAFECPCGKYFYDNTRAPGILKIIKKGTDGNHA